MFMGMVKWYSVEVFIKFVTFIVFCDFTNGRTELPDLNGSQVLTVCLGGVDSVAVVEGLMGEFDTEVKEWTRAIGGPMSDMCGRKRDVVKQDFNEKNQEEENNKFIGKIDIQVSKNVLRRFKKKLKTEGLHFYVKVSSLKRLIKENIKLNDEEALKRRINLRTGSANVRSIVTDSILGRYPRWQELQVWLESLQSLYPKLVTLESIGKTFEGRNIYVVKIKASDSPSSLPLVWVDAGTHAREWVTVSSAVFIITQILKILTNTDKTSFQSNNSSSFNNSNKNYKKENKYNDNNFLRTLVESVEWHIAPVLNPDGYSFSHTSYNARLWRKNRSLRSSGYSSRYNMQCHGADLNRNFDFMWGKIGASSDPCIETYRGERPNFENETKSQISHWLRHKTRLKGWLTMHSFGQMVMNRWAYRLINNTREYNRTLAVVKEMSDEMRKLNGQEYVPGPAFLVLYSFSGGAGDWVRHNVKHITHVYDMELRDIGHHGFLLPPSLSIPTAQEAWQALKVVAKHVVADARRGNLNANLADLHEVDRDY